MIRSARINCFGEGESRIEEMLGNLTARGQDPEVGITAHEATITLRITAQGSNSGDCEEKIGRTAEKIRQTLGSLVFGEEDEQLEDVVVKLARQKQATISVVELGGTAHLTQRFSRVDPSGGTFCGGLVMPSLSGLPTELDEAPADSSQDDQLGLLKRVAARTRRFFNADFVIGTWIPLEDKLMPEQESLIVLISESECFNERISAIGDHAIHHSRTAKVAKNLLRHHLMAQGSDSEIE